MTDIPCSPKFHGKWGQPSAPPPCMGGRENGMLGIRSPACFRARCCALELAAIRCVPGGRLSSERPGSKKTNHGPWGTCVAVCLHYMSLASGGRQLCVHCRMPQFDHHLCSNKEAAKLGMSACCMRGCKKTTHHRPKDAWRGISELQMDQ